MRRCRKGEVNGTCQCSYHFKLVAPHLLTRKVRKSEEDLITPTSCKASSFAVCRTPSSSFDTSVGHLGLRKLGGSGMDGAYRFGDGAAYWKSYMARSNSRSNSVRSILTFVFRYLQCSPCARDLNVLSSSTRRNEFCAYRNFSTKILHSPPTPQ